MEIYSAQIQLYNKYIVSSMEKLLTKYRVYSNTIVVCVDKKDHIDTFSSR